MNDPGITEPAATQAIEFAHAKRLEANIASTMLLRVADSSSLCSVIMRVQAKNFYEWC